MNIRLKNITENIHRNMIIHEYDNRIIRKYYIGNNIRFNIGDEDSFLFVDRNHYYYYIYLSVYYV